MATSISRDRGQTRARPRWRIGQRHLIPYLFILPNLVIFIVFLFGPTIYSFYMSFTNWDGLGSPEWIGLRNYERLRHDPVFRAAMRNTILYTIGTVGPMMVLALGMAMMVNARLPGRTFLRVVVYLPVVISWVAAALVWQLIFLHPTGFLNAFLGNFGFGPFVFTNNPTLALPAIVWMTIWKGLGFYMIIFLAGLQTIPGSLYEAASIDGASKWQQFWRITLPLLRPTTLFVLIIGIIQSFEVFIPIFLLTGGGPGYSTMVLVMAIYRFGFQTYEMGFASTIAVVMFLFVMIVSIMQLRLFGREVSY
jgi:multiple sugar transport system permease protein